MEMLYLIPTYIIEIMHLTQLKIKSLKATNSFTRLDNQPLRGLAKDTAFITDFFLK